LPLIIAARAAVCGALIVRPEAVDPYGRVCDPLVTLGWIAGWTERIGIGTSIVLMPLHNPMHLAKEVATLEELSGGPLHARHRDGLAQARVRLHGHRVQGPRPASRRGDPADPGALERRARFRRGVLVVP
jgi:hypothetical protein